jgi:SOS-response transcriptional repressor LexA
MKNRLLERLDALDLSQSELAERLGVSRQVVNGWVKGRSTPRDPHQVAELAKVLKCSVSYLIYGIREASDEDQADDGEYVSIPCFDAKASCGVGIHNDDVQMVKLIKVALSWLRSHVRSGSFDHLEIVTSSGDSMSPTIQDGDLVIIDTAEREIHSDRVYCLIVDSELYIKRVQRMPGGIRLLSDNNRYPPVDVTGDIAHEVIICGAARCVLEANAL